VSAGKRLLSNLVYSQNPSLISGLYMFDELFREGELGLYELIINHLQAYGTIPTQLTVEEKLGDVLVAAPEPLEFYMHEVENRYIQSELKKVAFGIQSSLNNQDPLKALEDVVSKISELSVTKERKSIIDFRYVADMIHAEYVSGLKNEDFSSLRFGWETLDKMTGGLRGGDVGTILGRPACLSGDTVICVSKGTCKDGTNYTLKQLYECFNGLGIKSNNTSGVGEGSLDREWDLSTPTKINSLKERSNIDLNEVVDIMYSGTKVTYTITTESGKNIRATNDHKFKVPHGSFKALWELKVGDYVVCRADQQATRSLIHARGDAKCEVTGEMIVSIDKFGEEDTYDVSMAYPYNNFVANDFVVHNSGKTFLGLHIAHNDWRGGGSPLFVSMEMSKLQIVQRLTAMTSHQKLSNLIKGMMSTKHYAMVTSTLEANSLVERPFWVLDGKLSATVEDIVFKCRQLHPTSVIVDGAYLLRHQNKKLDRWSRMTENAEGLKQQLSTDLDIPVLASYQFSREVAKKKKKDGEKAGLEDIYGSDAIGQLSSVVLGLFEEESIETEIRRKVDILKGRQGEKGSFLINWNFTKMDFSEILSKYDANGVLIQDTTGLSFLG